MTAIETSQPDDLAESPNRVLGFFTPSGLMLTLIIGLCFVGLYFRWFFHQAEISLGYPQDWGHAFVIPLIAGYMVYQKRQQIDASKAMLFWPAFVPFLLGMLTYAYALIMVRNHMIQGLGLILTLGSLTLWLIGPKLFRFFFLPIMYLLLMITISEQIMLMVTFKLQLIASQGSWLILSLIGTPFDWFTVDIDGNTLMLYTSSGEVLPMNVAEACSGMRMVVAFYALAIAVALMGSEKWWQRIALVLIAGPVAVFMNMIRVTVLGLLMLVSPKLAEGDAHTLIGTLLLIPSLALFLGFAWMLNRLVSPNETDLEASSTTSTGGAGS